MNDVQLTLRQAAEHYGIAYDRIRRAAYDGRLLCDRIENRWTVRPSEVERFLAEGGRAPHLEPKPRREGTADGRVIAVALPKGGTGKTTVTLNLGAALREAGQRVLLVDSDPGANLTDTLNYVPQRGDWTLQTAIEHYIKEFEPCLHQAITTTAEGLDLVPADADLGSSEESLRGALDPQRVLLHLLQPLRAVYDIILIDTMPYLGVLVQNALVAADDVLVPIQAQAQATEAGKKLLTQISLIIRSQLNPTLRVSGFLFTQVDASELNQREQMAYGRRVFGREHRVFSTMIEDRAVIRESQLQVVRQSLFSFRPTDVVTQAFRALAKEVLDGTA